MRRKKRGCSRCGKFNSRETALCLSCNMQILRERSIDLERLKKEVRASLTEQRNIELWDSWTSQRKKLAIFQLMEYGAIQWKITSKEKAS